MEVFWFFPTAGDERHLASPVGRREATYPYLSQIAVALDEMGYGGALLPTGIGCEDAWVMASALLPATRRLRFLVAARPGAMPPALSARMAATFDRISGGRLLINVVTGAGEEHLAAEGVFIPHERRYEATDDFLTIWRALLSGADPVDHDGAFWSIRGGRLAQLPVQTPYPPLYFGGSSPAALDVAAKHADVYLTWGEPPDQVAEKIAAVRRKADALGRPMRFGIRLHVVVRETDGAARAAADDLLSHVTDDMIAKVQGFLTQNNSESQRRMQRLHGGSRDNLEVSPNLWAGIGLVRPGGGTALVGDPRTVTARMREYADLGIDTFILSGYPHLEEAYRVAELLFPHLPLAPASVPPTRTAPPARTLLTMLKGAQAAGANRIVTGAAR